MDRSHWPLLLIEGILVFGGAIAFGWWQLRSTARDAEDTRRQREAEARAERAARETHDGPSA